MDQGSPSSSSSHTSRKSGSPTQHKSEVRNGDNAKHLVEIPLLPQPPIQCSNLLGLANTSFVNIVLENNSNGSVSSNFFRVSDEANKEVCKVNQQSTGNRGRSQLDRKGIEYLECCDSTGTCVMLIAYPIGLGEVALLSPKEEMLGECQSNVDFICLSVKVKYNFYDANGNRLMKMTALLRDEGNERKFILIVKRSKNEKLALIKMGSMKTCCHIKFKEGQTSVLERLQIIGLWIGFMHNELKDTETPALLERHAAIKLERKESRKKKLQITSDDSNGNDDKPKSEPQSPEKTHEQTPTKIGDNPHSPPEQMQLASNENEKNETKSVTKWKDLVRSKFSPNKHRQKYQVNNNDGEEKDRVSNRSCQL